MANLTAISSFGIDMFDWQEWGFDQYLSSSKSHYEYQSHDGNIIRVSGTEFSYDKNGEPTGGTVTTVSVFNPKTGVEIASVVLGDASLTELAADDFSSFWNVLLAGDDTIVTGHQDDNIGAFAGNDIVLAGGGDDDIFGGAGDDNLFGENGDDTVYGGTGDDTIVFNPGQGNDRIFGGAGNDTVVTHGVTTILGDSVRIERIAAADPEVRGPGGLKAAGGGARDSVAYTKDGAVARNTDFAATTDPQAFGDYAEFSSTTQSQTFGPYTDFSATADPQSSEDYNVLLEVGTSFGGATGGEVERTEAEISGVETIEVLTGDLNDSLTVEGLAGTSLENGHIIYDGGAGSDNLTALNTGTAITYQWRYEEGEGLPGGGLVKFGHSDQDTVHLIDEAHEGISITMSLNFVDALEIVTGVTGAPFSQELTVLNAERLDFDFGSGGDRVIINEDLADGYGGIIDINFGDGENLLDVYGHDGRIEAIGGNDNNSYYSGGGDDLLVGGNYHDEIFGGAGDDEIYGGGDFDEIAGGAGNDNLWGGEDGDRFFFEQGSGTDTIHDFVAGEAGNDVLDFLSLDTSIAELEISQVDQDTHVTTQFGDTVILLNVTASDLNSGDFLF